MQISFFLITLFQVISFLKFIYRFGGRRLVRILIYLKQSQFRTTIAKTVQHCIIAATLQNCVLA